MMLPVVFMVSVMFDSPALGRADAPIQYSSIMTFGITSSVISSVMIGLVSQLWLRRYHASWYNNLSLIFGSSLDGGAHVMLLVLSFTVLGGIEGAHKPFIQVSCCVF